MKERMKRELRAYPWLVTLPGTNPEEMAKTAQALYDRGVRFVTVDFHEDSVEQCAKTLLKVYCSVGEKMYVGANGITTAHQLLLAMEHGAAFVCADDASLVSCIAEGIPCITGTLPPVQASFNIRGVTAVDMTAGSEWEIV